MELGPGEEKIIAVNFSWYLPNSTLSAGTSVNAGSAFGERPSAGTASNQQEVSGFAGKQLVNTFDPHGDGQTGILQSPTLTLDKRYLKFLVGGGSNAEQTAVRLLIDGKVTEMAAGNQTENLVEKVWDLKKYKGKKAVIHIVDQSTGSWGHILADQFVLTDNVNEDLYNLSSQARLIAGFEDGNYDGWKKIQDEVEGNEEIDPFYRPWYSGRFKNLDDVVEYWISHASELRKKSELFRDAFFNSTLPGEVLDITPLNAMIKNQSGGAFFIASPDEVSPQKAVYASDTNDHWKYGKNATQYWYCPEPTSRLEGLVNGRYTYWASHSPIPGGISFENFELNEPFSNGAKYVFGVSPLAPNQFIEEVTEN